MIWHATIWVLWQVRNHIISRNDVKYVEDLVEEIMVLSWP